MAKIKCYSCEREFDESEIRWVFDYPICRECDAKAAETVKAIYDKVTSEKSSEE